jgi:HEAT repeat protein
MNPDYMLACGIVWHKTADPEAGLELVEALDSPDLSLRSLARALLVDGDEDSLRLLEGALIAGVVSPEAASGCIADILRIRQDKWKPMEHGKRLWGDSLSC